MAQLEAGAVELEFAELGMRRSWDELKADLLEQRLVSRVGMEKVEERFVLHLDQVRVMFAVKLCSRYFRVCSLSPVKAIVLAVLKA